MDDNDMIENYKLENNSTSDKLKKVFQNTKNVLYTYLKKEKKWKLEKKVLLRKIKLMNLEIKKYKQLLKPK